MKIDRNDATPVIPAVPVPAVADPSSRSVRPATADAGTSARRGPAPRRDSVEISAEARERSGVDATRETHLERVRHRLAQGFYSSAEAREALAERLLGSGDL